MIRPVGKKRVGFGKPLAALALSAILMIGLSPIMEAIVGIEAESAYAAEYTKDDVKGMIDGLPSDARDYSPADLERVEAVKAAYDSLSEEDRAALDSDTSYSGGDSSQPLGRILESACWTVWSFAEPDNSTTLKDGIYDAYSVPALSSEYSKGKSTSPRQKPWSVKSITVADGKAYATLAVESTTYSGVMLHNKTYGKTNQSGNCEFAGIPIDLNSTFYFNGVSTTMPAPIAFSLTTSINEPAAEGGDEISDLERVKQMIEMLPTDPYKVTAEHVPAIERTQAAYEALSDEDKKTIDSESLSNSASYGRVLEGDVWAADSLNPIDNSTALADGIYENKETVKDAKGNTLYMGLIENSAHMGKSDSARGKTFTVRRVTVKDGKATALIEHTSSYSDTLKIGGQIYKNLTPSGNSTFEIPIDLNSTMHFSYMGKGAQENTVAIAFEMTTKADEAALKPNVDPSKEESGDGGNGDGDKDSSSKDGEGGQGGSGGSGGGSTDKDSQGGKGGDGGSGNGSSSEGSGKKGNSSIDTVNAVLNELAKGIEKAKGDAAKLLENARAEAQRILDDANKQAAAPANRAASTQGSAVSQTVRPAASAASSNTGSSKQSQASSAKADNANGPGASSKLGSSTVAMGDVDGIQSFAEQAADGAPAEAAKKKTPGSDIVGPISLAALPVGAAAGAIFFVARYRRDEKDL